jgi:hypothetical protein
LDRDAYKNAANQGGNHPDQEMFEPTAPRLELRHHRLLHNIPGDAGWFTPASPGFQVYFAKP